MRPLLLAGTIGTLMAVLPGWAQVTVQDPGNVVGSGDGAWSYLILEAEDFHTKSNENPEAGFIRVDDSGSMTSFRGDPILGPNTTASKKAALYTLTGFGEHSDKVTYTVQFVHPGTYYLYMRFTMYENGGNEVHYLNEDSFFVPPDFNADPQTDWPLPRGGYAEGCCGISGFLWINEGDLGRVDHSMGDEEGAAFWEGNFHWNELRSSQFNNPETTGEPNVHFAYEVTAERVGQPLEFTISYREGGVTIDLLLFSTNPELMTEYSQEELDAILLGAGGSAPSLAIRREGDSVVLSWPASAEGFVLESTPSLSPATWTAVSETPTSAGGQSSVTIGAGSGTRYFRLRRP
ncbi:MAG: hypothetical protein KF833_22350 [Verrucomicrobiae bacterium]|nr:hypothetical protein [Verrucomicrobiae bacterium]